MCVRIIFQVHNKTVIFSIKFSFGIYGMHPNPSIFLHYSPSENHIICCKHGISLLFTTKLWCLHINNVEKRQKNVQTTAETVLKLQNHANQSLKDQSRKSDLVVPQKCKQTCLLSENMIDKYLNLGISFSFLLSVLSDP